MTRLTIFILTSIFAGMTNAAKSTDAISSPHTFKVISCTSMADTDIYPAGTMKISYRSKFDGKNDWALYMLGNNVKNAIVYLHGSFSTGDQIFTRKDIM